MNLDVFGGLAIPIGRLARNAKTGFTGGLQLTTRGSVGLLVNFSYSNNPSKASGSWGSFYFLAGLKVSLKENKNTDIFFGFPCLGGLYSTTPTTDAQMPSKNYSGLASGVIFCARKYQWLTMELRVVGGMIKSKSGYIGYSGFGGYLNDPDMYIGIALIDLSLGLNL
jgi:hypothetical protein